MSKNRIVAAWAAVLALTAMALGQPQAGEDGTAPTQTVAPARSAAPLSPAATAIGESAQANKYIFLFFYRTDDETTQAARKSLEAAMEKLSDRANSVSVNVTDPKERLLVAKYELTRSPMPLVLAIAPTGAVTRSFAGRVAEHQFEAAFVSPGMQRCLKAIQDRKLVFLCVQNGATQHNAEAMQGVRELTADPLYASTTEVITIDPADAAEESLLKQFKVDAKTEEAVTVFLAPPGKTIATYTGETKKDVLVAAAKTAAKGCDPKSGCCPPKKPADPSTDKKP